MQLKAMVKNKAEKVGLPPHFAMQTYMMECLLERISLSTYKMQFVIKGGFFISAMIGIDMRATMDLDTTLVNHALTLENISKILNEVISVEVDDEVRFNINSITDIRKTDEYSGFRVHLEGVYPPIAQPLTVDITTGDKITPREIKFMYPLIFKDKSIPVLAYNIETLIAEKLETIISRSITNTRPRDFYDVYMLWNLEGNKIDIDTLGKALKATCEHRNSLEKLVNWKNELEQIRVNTALKTYWGQYRKEFSYASEIEFEDTCNVIQMILSTI